MQAGRGEAFAKVKSRFVAPDRLLAECELSTGSDIGELFEEIRYRDPPGIFEIQAENGWTLTLGLGPEVGRAQYAPSDGMPPYWVAVNDGSVHGDHIFNYAPILK